MRQLIKNTSIMGITKILLVGIGIARNKYLASTIGPQGFGIYNLLMYFFHLGDIIAGTTLGGASLKYMAEYNSKGEIEKVEATFNIAFFIVFVLVTIITAIYLIFYESFKSIFLSSEITFTHYFLFALSYFFSILSGIMESGVKGLLMIKDLAKRSIITSIFGFLSLFICVYFWRLNGFFLNLVIVSFIGTALLFNSLRKIITIKLKIPDFKGDIFHKILKFSFFDMFSNTFMVIGEYLKRKFIVPALSVSSLGIYSAANSLSNHCMLVSQSAQSYMFPKMSENQTMSSRNKLASDYIKLVSMSLAVINIIVISFCKEIVLALYSKEFMEISTVLIWFMLGLVINSVQYCYLWTVYGMAELKIFTTVVVLSDLLSIYLSWLFISGLGYIALPLSATISSMMRIIIWAIFLRKKYNIWLGFKSMHYVVFSIMVTLLSYFTINLSLVKRLCSILILLLLVMLSIGFKNINKMINGFRSIIQYKYNNR